MYAADLLRITSQLLHAILGGMAVFCLYYAAVGHDNYDLVRYCLLEALKWGGAAGLVLYFKEKYLPQ